MKQLLIFTLLCGSLALGAQDTTSYKPDIYKTNGGELIFSFADFKNGDADVSNVLRFSAFFHVGQKWHFDFGDHFGLFTGYGIRNIGFITQDDGVNIAAFEDQIRPGDEVKIKRRAYALGVPAAIKLGNMKRNAFVYGGAELELLFHYKEKLFIDGKKEDKYREWFSDRTNILSPSIFAGVQLPGGANLQVKYYLTNFLNQSYTERAPGGGNQQPYQNVESQMFYLALSFNFRDSALSTPPAKRTEI